MKPLIEQQNDFFKRWQSREIMLAIVSILAPRVSLQEQQMEP